MRFIARMTELAYGVAMSVRVEVLLVSASGHVDAMAASRLEWGCS